MLVFSFLIFKSGSLTFTLCFHSFFQSVGSELLFLTVSKRLHGMVAWRILKPLLKLPYFCSKKKTITLSLGQRRCLHQSTPSPFVLVFSVTPFKMDQNKNQNRSIDKVQNLGNERRYIYKDPRQDSGQRNISYTRYPKKCFTQTFRDLETPCWCSPGCAPTWRT